MMQERDGIYYAFGKMYIGDSAQTSNTSFSDSGRVIQYGTSQYYNSSNMWSTSFDTNGSGLVVEDGESYSTTFSDGVIVGTENGRSGSTFIGNSDQNISMDFYGGNNSSSITTLYGTTLKNIKGTINSGNNTSHKFLGCSFIECSQFDPVGAPLIRNCTFAETVDTDAALLWNSGINIEDTSFIANTLGAAYEYPTQGTYGQTDLTYSGNTYDILYSDAASSGVLTINATDSNLSISEMTNSTGNSVSIVNSVNLEVNGVKTGNEPTNYVRCRIEKASDGTTIMNKEANTADGSTYKATEAYNYAGDVDVIIKARYKGYLPFKTTGKITSSGLTVTAVWITDPNYT